MIENGVKIFYMRNQRGQAAIFVALMFNVLFVFFAMAINVALVVHDKINMQNSLDLAAYYGAMKQAEILNAIAHENYMIRQSWKLMAWRYRVLGTAGIFKNPVSDKHPSYVDNPVANPKPINPLAEEVYDPAGDFPMLCVAYYPVFQNIPPNQSLCNSKYTSVPALPNVSKIAGFIGINVGIAALSQSLIKNFDASCDSAAATNWWFASSIFHAYRLDQRNRKQVIKALAQNLSNSPDDFLDLNGESVLEGARKTFEKNLTFANYQAYQAQGKPFKLFNSLGGVAVTEWLPEIQIAPTIIYTDFKVAVDANGACIATAQDISQLPARDSTGSKLLKPALPNGFDASDLISWAPGADILMDSDYQMSIGVEKNPWYMVYIGAQSALSPHQIFFPIGNGVKTVGRSFAKPFGGRIGPWYKDTWQQGDKMSSGNKTDSLMAPRLEQGGLMNGSNDKTRYPNYSRFPGDTLGLSAKLAQSALLSLQLLRLHAEWYLAIKYDMAPGAPNDILMWNPKNPADPEFIKGRSYEIASFTPDLFDITYYSIEPNFFANYLVQLRAHATALGIPASTPLRADLGHSVDKPNFTIQDQLKLLIDIPYQRQEAYWYVRERKHLLTGWLPGKGAFNYDTTASYENFGKCGLQDDSLKFTSPGSCAGAGGRTGYSVKLIGRDALLSQQHKIGGPGASPGGIKNPPAGIW